MKNLLQPKRMEQLKLKSEKENKANIKNNFNTCHCWPRGACILVGDSMLEDIAERNISSKLLIKVRGLSGADIDDMYDHLKPILL